MALPIIVTDSNGGGSDSNNSGAGPGDGTTSGTPITSTTISTDAAGTTVTIPNADLTNVATDGSHVVFIDDATAGARNFGKITGKANSGTASANVTVANAFTINMTNKTGGIGGKRLTIAGSKSVKLFSNNAAAGDAMPGWIVEMLSAHAESISAAIDFRRAGDATSGAIILRGRSGAATLPKITVTANVNTMVLRAAYLQFKDFNIEAASAAVTCAFINTVSGPFRIENIQLTRTSTNVFTTGIDLQTNTGDAVVIGCEVQRCSVGIKPPQTLAFTILNNYIHDCSSHGIDCGTADLGGEIFGNIIAACGGDGIHSSFNGVNTARSLTIAHNTIDSNTSDGIEFTAAMADSLENVRILNNILSNNGGYGLKFSDAGATLIALQARGIIVKGNDTYNNTSGAYLPASLGEDDPGLNPTYTGGGDYSIGTNLKAKGYPVGGSRKIGSTGSTYSYVDPGAAQRQEAGAAGGGANLLGQGTLVIA